jgi:hypothetical protein
MSATLPISVVIPSFNHEAYISESIESILSQSSRPAEIIVVDDCSTDQTLSVLGKYSQHIKIIPLPSNRGAADATNIGIQNSTNPFIAILNSDDCWKANKLELQLDFMRSSDLQISFTTADIIDSNSRIVSNYPPQFDVFSRITPVNNSFLFHFFYFGNFLCHPSLLIEKNIYERFGYYSNKFRQLPDLERWINFAKTSQMGVLEEKLVNFRWNDEVNTSSQTDTASYIRTQNEHLPIYLRFFENVPDAEIRDIFATEIDKLDGTLKDIAIFDPGTALLLGHPEKSVNYQTTLAGYLRLMMKSQDPTLDKKTQEIASTFQIKINNGDLENLYLDNSNNFKLRQKMHPQLRHLIRRILG